jgi:hypothetical protein
MAEPRRRRSPSILILILVGAIGLVTLMGRPRFQTYATVDVLQLLASGLCFGLALGALLQRWRGDGE